MPTPLPLVGAASRLLDGHHLVLVTPRAPSAPIVYALNRLGRVFGATLEYVTFEGRPPYPSLLVLFLPDTPAARNLIDALFGIRLRDGEAIVCLDPALAEVGSVALRGLSDPSFCAQPLWKDTKGN